MRSTQLNLLRADAPTVTLGLNQPLAGITNRQVTLEPAVPVTSTALNNEAVRVTLGAPLSYGTTYTLTTHDAVGAANGRRGDLVATFTTAEPQAYVLQPGCQVGVDCILRVVPGGTTTTVYQGAHIADFVLAGDHLVVQRSTSATPSATSDDTLTEVDPATGESTPVALPGHGWIKNLHSTGRASDARYGFLFTDMGQSGASAALYIADAAAGSAPAAAKGFLKTNADVVTWTFAPDSSTVAVLTAEGQGYLIDSTGATPALPLGSLGDVLGFTTDGSALIAVTADAGFVSINLATQWHAPVATSAVVGGRTVRALTPLHHGRQLIASLEHAGADGTPDRADLVLIDGTSVRPLTSTAAVGLVTGVELSPNDQIVAWATQATGTGSKTKPSTITFVDATTNAVVGQVPGTAVAWAPLRTR